MDLPLRASNEGLTLFLPAHPRGAKTPRLPPGRALREHRRPSGSTPSYLLLNRRE